jgi:UTP--glucose-1-phosphate uridylyltransferase
MKMNIKTVKAVIPAAGLGTRMRHLNAGLPKEMMKVGGKPAIRHVVEEAYLSGIRHIAVIVNPQKDLIIRYFSEEPGAPEAEGRGGDLMERIRKDVRFTFPVQSRPAGAADAVCRARDFVGDGPFALLYPDNIIFTGTNMPAIGQLMDAAEAACDGAAVCGLHRIGPSEAARFGHCGGVSLGRVKNGLWPVVAVQDKGKGHFQLPPSGRGVRMFPRHILPPAFFERVEKEAGRRGEGEIDDVPIFQAMCGEGLLYGKFVSGKLYDVGNEHGYADANRHLARSGVP